jgi:hypothetical protein
MCLYSIFELRMTLTDGAESISSKGCNREATTAVHIARVQGKEQGTRYLEHTGETQRAYSGCAERKTLLIFILARNQTRRHWVYSGNYPEHSLLPRTRETQKPSVSRQSGAGPILLLALLASMTSAYSSLGVSRESNPQPQLLKVLV